MVNSKCQHFDNCGGCSLQHLSEDEYYLFKKDILTKIIVRLGCKAEILADVVRIPAGTRRRAEFKVAVNKGNISLGFCEAKSNVVVDISMCLVLEPEIFELSKALRELLSTFKKPGNIDGINVTKLNDGYDIFFVAKSPIITQDKDRIIEFSKQNNILRCGERIDKQDLKVFFNSTAGIVNFGDAKVELPAGAFLQATKAGQDAITSFVLEHTNGSKNVADLYSGCGTYSFPTAQNGAHVSAYEGSYDMVLAMNNAIRQNKMDDLITAQSRDLYKNPVRADELKQFDAIIINPPRNGALPQVQQITKSDVANVIMVSCNPQTFERDAKCLLDSGYTLEKIVPIDQFLWSNHLELTAYFKK